MYINGTVQSVVNIYIDDVLLNPKYITDFKKGSELFDDNIDLETVSSQYIELQIHKSSGITKPKTIKIEYGILVNNALTVAEVNKMLVCDLNKLKVKSLSKHDDSFEMIPIGLYNVDDYDDEDDNVINIKALDNIIKLDTDDGYYDASELINQKGYATLGEIAEDICKKKGLEFATSSFLGFDKKITVYDNQITARQYLGYIAEQAGCFCCADRLGKICFRSIGQDEENVPLRLFKTYKFGEEYKISKVAYEDGTRCFKFGDDTGNTLWINQENIFIVDEEQIQNIYSKMKGLTINSFEGTVIINPAVDIGDKINIDGKVIIYQGEMTLNKRFIADIKSKIGIKAKQETTVKKESQTIINRRVQSRIDEQEGKIEQLVEETSENSQKLSQHEQTIDSITDTVSSVETKIETVENKADTAQETADNAQSAANTANTNAQNAQDVADEAISKITTTTEKLTQVEQTVGGITQSVSEVETKIETVETKADNAQSSANNAQDTADNINNNLTQNYYTKTETNSQIQQTADTINQTVQQTIDKTNKISGEVEQQSSKLTEIEQSLDGISQRVETIQDVTQTVEGTKTITLANCVEGDLLELHIYGNNSVFKYLYPADDLFPSDTLYPYGDSRVVVADENNNSKTYELGVTDTLRKNGNICDEYILEGGKAKVIRRINKNGTIKSTETVENLGEYSIRLKNGTNKITIKNYTATIKAKYAIQNDYTEIFSTKVETKTAIKQTAEDIDISVNKKFESYSTTTEMNSAINLKANEINQKVEKKVDEETITGAYLVLKINEDKSESKLNADKIDISANDVLNILSGNTINLKTKNIKIESNNFSVDENGNIVAKSGTIGGWTVNSEAIFNGKGLGQEGSVGISCKIDDWAFWAGNGVFKVSPSGALTATNATITGKITASSGSIGGAQINNQGLYFNNDSESTGWGLWGTTANANIVMHAGAKSNNIGGAPFKIYHDGSVYMSKGQISGNLITSGINANNITGGSLSMSRISGGTLNVGSNGGYLRVGVGYTHPEVSGLNVGDNGININSGRLIITSGGNWSYIRSSYGLDNIRLLDSSGSNIPCGGSDYMSFMDIAMVVKYCREHGYSSSI